MVACCEPLGTCQHRGMSQAHGDERGGLGRPAGRATPARLTREGSAPLQRADAAVRMADQRILARLGADELRHLKRLRHAAATTRPADSDKSAELDGVCTVWRDAHGPRRVVS